MSNPTDLGIEVPHVLREYALLADGERGILVGPRGDYTWMCFPGWDGDGVFSSLIGGAGAYAVTPVGRFVWGGYYEHPGLIWRSRWTCDDGTVVECREALALPASPDRAVILRRIVAVQGPAQVRVVLDLRTQFGHPPGTSAAPRRGWHVDGAGGRCARALGRRARCPAPRPRSARPGADVAARCG